MSHLAGGWDPRLRRDCRPFVQLYHTTKESFDAASNASHVQSHHDSDSEDGSDVTGELIPSDCGLCRFHLQPTFSEQNSLNYAPPSMGKNLVVHPVLFAHLASSRGDNVAGSSGSNDSADKRQLSLL